MAKVKKEQEQIEENKQPEITAQEQQPETTQPNPDEMPHCCGGAGCDKQEEQISKEQELTAEIARLTAENAKLSDDVKRIQAELVGYRIRKDEETASLLKYANQDLILDIIKVVDNFERAIKLDDATLSPEVSKFLSGFKMMYASLTETLKKFGVEEINRVGQIFDPNEEQAMLTDNIPEMEDEAVIEVLLKGYKLKGRVIRPASVKINQK